ncbi:MAG: Hsp20/alpha crystallin family protein [Phycisphaeraceae bacterium]
MIELARRPMPGSHFNNVFGHPAGQPHFSRYCPIEAWTPNINAYAFDDRLEVCVDLAGVERGSINVHVEPGILIISGQRQPPEAPTPQAPDTQGQVPRILAMEIDYGPFERKLQLPEGIDTEHITADQCNGLLWIHLPRPRPGKL